MTDNQMTWSHNCYQRLVVIISFKKDFFMVPVTSPKEYRQGHTTLKERI